MQQKSPLVHLHEPKDGCTVLPPLFICFSQNRPHRVPSYPAAVTWQRRRNLPDKPHVFRCAAHGLYSPVLCHCLAPAGSSLMTNLDPVLRSGHSFFYFFISLRHFFLFVKGFEQFHRKKLLCLRIIFRLIRRSKNQQ